MSDFVSVIDEITTFVRNERVKAYNDGVDMVLGETRKWMASNGIPASTGEHIGIPDLLGEIKSALMKNET